MLSSITPLGERGRDNRYWLTVSAYIGASVLGGAATGAAMGAVGQLLLSGLPGDPVSSRVRLGLLAAVAVAGLVADLGIGGARVPTIRRQVNEQWVGRYRGWVYGAGFGFQLGTGIVTIVTSAITWVALCAVVLTGSWVAGLGLGAVFGSVRSLPLLLTTRVRSPAALRTLHLRNHRLASTASRVAIGGQVLTVLAAAYLTVTVTT